MATNMGLRQLGLYVAFFRFIGIGNADNELKIIAQCQNYPA